MNNQMRRAAEQRRRLTYLQAFPEADSPITITAAVLTFTAFNECTLTLTLSSPPGDFAYGTPTESLWHMHAAGRTWSFSTSDLNIIDSTIVITGIDGTVADANYSTAQDLFTYDGGEETQEPLFPAIAAVTNLPVTFTGGALAVPSGTWSITDSDFASCNGTISGDFSIVMAPFETEPGSEFYGETGSHVMSMANPPTAAMVTDTTLTITFICDGAAHVDVAQLGYNGTNPVILDGLGRPVPPFIKALS